MRRLLKVQREWAFIDVHLLFRRKSVQKSTVPSKLVEIFPYSGSLVKFLQRRMSPLWKIIFRDPREQVKSLPVQASDHMSIPECSISRNGPAVSYIVKQLRPCRHLFLEEPLAKRGEEEWAFLGMAWKGGDPHCFYVTDDIVKGKAYKHVQIMGAC